MTPKPPRAAAWLIEFFVPPATAEPAVGDLAEEFTARAAVSKAAARRWHWRQTISTLPRLMWASVRMAPWSATAIVLGGLALAGLADRATTNLASVLLTRVNAYDYISAIWFWRAVDAIRFVIVPLAIGWSCALIARDREMVITALSAGVLMVVLAWNLAVLMQHFVPSDPLLGSPGGRRFLYEVVQSGTTVPLSLVAGGILRRIQQMRARIATS